MNGSGGNQVPELRRLETRVAALTVRMLVSTDWEARSALWQQILATLKRRSPEVVEQLERERLERVGVGQT